MATIPVRVEMAAENGIDREFVKDGQKNLPFVGKALGPRRLAVFKPVLQGILVHENDFPFLPGLPQILPQPGQLFLLQVRLEFFQLAELCIHDRKVDLAHIETVELAAVLPLPSFRQGRKREEARIGLGHADLPVQGIRFVVA